MELKPGYKQTEVGVIPEDWDDRSLGQIRASELVKICSTRDHVKHPSYTWD